MLQQAAVLSMCQWNRGAWRLPRCCGCPAVLGASRQMHHRKHLPWLAWSMGAAGSILPAARLWGCGAGDNHFVCDSSFQRCLSSIISWLCKYSPLGQHHWCISFCSAVLVAMRNDNI